MLVPLFLSCQCLLAFAYGQSIDTITTTFEESFSSLWGQTALQDGIVEIKLDRSSGSGFRSIDRYEYGLFSALIKLPPEYSAGVVTAFYTSNYEDFPNNHDELDFEFLGVVPGMSHVLQTNIYGDGSVQIGREERISLWFDPTADFHRYSILWNSHQIVFFVDNIPIRQMVRSDELGQQYPSKPMKNYGSIWDGSNWATDGGRAPVNYDYSPFISSFSGFGLQGCKVQSDSTCQDDRFMQTAISTLTQQQKQDLSWVRANHMMYSYCEDTQRYPTPPTECTSALLRHYGTRKHKMYRGSSSKDLKFSTASPASIHKQC